MLCADRVGPSRRIALYQLAYISSATSDLSDVELRTLLEAARDRNRAQGITGLLLHRRGTFVQVLEGRAEDVKDVFTSIAADPRHRGVHPLYARPRADREFAAWTMAFVAVDDYALDDVEAFSSFADTCRALDEQAVVSRASRLLLRFRELVEAGQA